MSIDIKTTYTSATIPQLPEPQTNNVADTLLPLQINCHIIFLKDNPLHFRCRVADNFRNRLNQSSKKASKIDVRIVRRP